MVLIYFSGVDLQGNYRECYYGGQSIDECFNMLSVLAGTGWQLIWARLSESSGNSVDLPIEVFDGTPLQETLEKLQQEWEEVLYQR